jgi:hypothetical protein
VIDRQSKSGGALFYVTVHAEFDFVSAIDGTTHTAATFGEAMDSGDKATNKAMSAAYKYAAFMTFAIPTEGDNDADARRTRLRRARTPMAPPPRSRRAARPDPDARARAGKTLQGICEAYKVAELKELTEAQADKLIERLQASQAKEPVNA